ncbi:MAG: branched-chain amino acid transport system ATP-binding protein [Actinomycetota bacterium]|nr:branched-chain amino acid transport system ATP-binding protein [Actinomycetota bacterium]
MTAPALAVRGLSAGWGATAVVQGADLDVAGGEVVAVLGGNGSGKSSLLLAVAGLLRPRSGEVVLDGRRLGRMAADRRARLGLRLLPQTRRVFPSLTVRENLEAVELGLADADVADVRVRRAAWLERFPALASRLDEPAAGLSGGQQQLLAIGRVLSVRPRVLLADEPSAGLSPARADACGQAILVLAAEGAAVVLVEQNVTLARRLAGRVLRMHDGRRTEDDGQGYVRDRDGSAGA